MARRIANPFPFFYDRAGRPLDAGRVFIGQAGLDPEANPLPAFADAALTIPLAQPVRTLGGRLASNGSPVLAYVGSDNYSLRARDESGAEVFYLALATQAETPSQPLSDTLTALAALTTTPFGRSLLQLANSAALKAAANIPDALPLTGGTVTGPIIRSGAGAYGYHADPAFTSFRVFKTAKGAADPTLAPGDIWLEEL